MTRIENQLVAQGFSLLQEKENFMYYEKTIQDFSAPYQQVCVVYDKKEEKICSMDGYSVSEDEMTINSIDSLDFERTLSVG